MGLRSWRLNSYSTPNISEAVNKEANPVLQRRALTPLRSRREEVVRGSGLCRRPSPSLSCLTCLDGAVKTTAVFSEAVPSLSRPLSVPEARRRCSSPSTGFSSITITARRLSLSGDLPSRSSPETRPQPQSEQFPWSSTMTLKDDVVQKPLFRSFAHLDLRPCQPTSSAFYLDKSLSIPLGSLQEARRAVFRSTLSLQLGTSPVSSSEENRKAERAPFAKPNTVDCIRNGNRGRSPLREDVAAVRSGDERKATLPSFPFRARCHSSSPAISLSGTANDATRPQRANRKGGVEGSESSGLSVGSSPDARVLCSHVEAVRRGREGPGSSHMFTSFCGSNGTNEPRSLSLKEALELFRPDFISRSKRRVLHMEQRARERRNLQVALTTGLESTNRRRSCTKPHPLCDNLFKPKDRMISDKEMQLRSRRIYKKLPEVTKRKEEERRRLVVQANRLRAEVFKKKLLDQILQRNSD